MDGAISELRRYDGGLHLFISGTSCMLPEDAGEVARGLARLAMSALYIQYLGHKSQGHCIVKRLLATWTGGSSSIIR